MKCSVRATAEADNQAVAADQWWRNNRPAAPGLFDQEMESALERLGRLPEVGRLHPTRGRPGLRRLYLRGTRHHVYYVYNSEARQVVVLAVWSAARGKGPPLRGR